MKDFTHVDDTNKAIMVDVTSKNETRREATAQAEVLVSNNVFEKLKDNAIEKGDVLSVAKIAGIQGAKRTSELIPLCHNIFISNLDLKIKLDSKRKAVVIRATAKTVSKTGVEMEALTGASIAALTVYDMCKALDKSIVISNVKLVSKTGGKSGDFKNSENKI
ncbi:MAG: cyclic pyranopterin monophosphate synthase MoaC [Bacteroidetes bacterium]|nr:cyclic pyranopterin monophosphate synthase MoaC [Bacteroidota bacterium]